MKIEIGDRVRIYNYKDSTYDTGIIVEIYDESYKIKHDEIEGHFILSKKMIRKE
tara:strand:+ start:9949 stop:10110 length:162 start_codon:yes stop_codon:yes gene_type:complete